MRKFSNRRFSLILLLTGCCLIGHASSGHATTVAVVGSLQSELGCPGDWQPDCSATELAMGTSDQVWRETFDVIAGSFEYKVALDDGFTENYGLHAQPNGANIPLNLPSSTPVRFYYDEVSHWVTDNVNSVIATLPGSFQSELGCAGDWDPACMRSWLQDIDGDGIYTADLVLPTGPYEVKVAYNESWDVNYGLGGVLGGANILFYVLNGNPVHFSYDPNTHMLTIGDDDTTSPVPVPAALPLLASGLGALGFAGWRRHRYKRTSQVV